MQIHILGLGLLASVFASDVYGQGKTTLPTPTPEIKPGPCYAVMSACRAAGYTQGGHKNGKGIHADCVGKLFRGETVAGVSVTKDQIKECQDRHNLIDAGGASHGKIPK